MIVSVEIIDDVTLCINGLNLESSKIAYTDVTSTTDLYIFSKAESHNDRWRIRKSRMRVPFFSREREYFCESRMLHISEIGAGASIHFSDWGGGGKSKEISKFRRAPQNWKLCMFRSYFYVKFMGFVVLDSTFNLNLFLHYVLWLRYAPIFSLEGRRPPPQNRRLWIGDVSLSRDGGFRWLRTNLGTPSRKWAGACRNSRFRLTKIIQKRNIG